MAMASAHRDTTSLRNERKAVEIRFLGEIDEYDLGASWNKDEDAVRASQWGQLSQALEHTTG